MPVGPMVIIMFHLFDFASGIPIRLVIPRGFYNEQQLKFLVDQMLQKLVESTRQSIELQVRGQGDITSGQLVILPIETTGRNIPNISRAIEAAELAGEWLHNLGHISYGILPIYTIARGIREL